MDELRPDQFRRIRDVFEAALERPQNERRAFIERASDGDTVLLLEVEGMLAAEEQSKAVLDVPPAAAVSAQSASISYHSRLGAGALIAGRFRIVAGLGAGGMGEVYRADDLELQQPVAIKFLTMFRSEERARARLRSEVRLARQISHPNVCRVYDIGEAGGDLYLTMEYVDGEDLAALLKRIPHVPLDRGVEIARKLCAGLAAAHARGVLHRDFKPANVMIDSPGDVRIMDFGLAAIVSASDAADIRSGTPAYMAPEQLAGREVTARSDIYALGLVLYELFTGTRPFDADTAEEFLRLREGSRPARPSTLVPELGARIEQAILGCLDPNPKMRPQSPLQVLALLPGGDPLAEALAARETPSPETVAAAGPTESLKRTAAIALLSCAAAGLVAICGLTSKVQTLGMLPLEQPPETLVLRARDTVRKLGYVDPPTDYAFGFQIEVGSLDYYRGNISATAGSRLQQWRRIFAGRPSPVSFWYRESPTPMVVESREFRPDYRVSMDDPFPGRPGMLSAVVDLTGRLRRFTAIPRDDLGPHPDSRLPEWSTLFAAAGLNMGRFDRTAPALTSIGRNDVREAWIGSDGGGAAVPVRVEAAAYAGKVTHFEVRFPWTPQNQPAQPNSDPPPIPAALIGLSLMLAIVLVARRNVIAGRADTHGASRIAIFFALALLVSSIFAWHQGSARWALADLQQRVLPAVFLVSVMTALSYLAIEPWVRRHWPQTMITWSRVLAGRWGDPVVGGDCLVAITCAIVNVLLLRMIALGAIAFGGIPVRPSTSFSDWGVAFDVLMGGRALVRELVVSCLAGFNSAAQFCFVLFLLRALLRKPWLAVVAWLIVSWSVIFVTRSGGNDGSQLMFEATAASFALIVLAYRGLLTAVVFNAVTTFVDRTLLTLDLTAWYGQSSLVGVVVVSVMALWAFRVSLGSQALFPTASVSHRSSQA